MVNEDTVRLFLIFWEIDPWLYIYCSCEKILSVVPVQNLDVTVADHAVNFDESGAVHDALRPHVTERDQLLPRLKLLRRLHGPQGLEQVGSLPWAQASNVLVTRSRLVTHSILFSFSTL